jgi:hypothetical protein
MGPSRHSEPASGHLGSCSVTRRTTCLLGFLVVLGLCLATGGLLALRGGGREEVAIEGGNLAGTALRPAGDPAAGSATGAPPAATVAGRKVEALGARKPAATKAPSGKAEPPRHKPAAKPVVTIPASGSSVKKGAGIFGKPKGITTALTDSGVSWSYNWAATPNGVTVPKGVEFVPMIWGARSVDAGTLAAAKRNGSVLLGFNEPDFADQADMSPEQALDLWPKLEATGLRLGSPAVAWGADQDGKWLDRFMDGASARGYRVDFVTLHWYGGDFNTTNATNQLRSYIRSTYAKYHKPIWVTEYALMNFSSSPRLPSAAVQADFVVKSTAMLERLSYVERYAWFAFPTATDGTDGTGLYRPGGVPTLPGRAYRAAGQ